MRPIRRVCLSYPEAWEDAPWGHPVFKAGKKMFCVVGDADGGRGLVCPVGYEVQESLHQQGRYYRPS